MTIIIDMSKSKSSEELNIVKHKKKGTRAVNEIEKAMDREVKHYKCSDKNPMIGVSQTKSKKQYKVQYGDLNTTITNLITACNKVKEYIDKNEMPNKPELKMENPEGMLREDFEYYGKMFMIYWYNDEPLFDIRHILSVLGQKDDTIQKKYKK